MSGAGASLKQILSWFVTGLLEAGLLSQLCQEGISSHPHHEPAPAVPAAAGSTCPIRSYQK